MFTSRRKHKNLFIGVFEYAETISNLTTLVNQENSVKIKEIQDGHPEYSRF